MKLSALLLALVLNGPGSQILTVPEPNRIEAVDVTNNRRIPSDTIKYNIQTKPGDTFNFAMIQRDIRNLYAMGFFDDITVFEEEGENGKIITFEVVEKPLIRAIDYEGHKSVSLSDILERLREKKVGLSQESPYDPTRVKRAEVVLLDLLAEKGRQNAVIEVETYPIPPNAIGVAFIIDEGPKVKIERINIEGNEIFSDRKVKRAMKLLKEAGPITPFTSKDVYHELKMGDDITRIRMMYAENGYVRTVISEPEIEVRPHKVYRTLPFIKLPFPWGIPIPFWRKEVDRFFITIRIEENQQYKVGDVQVTGNNEFTDFQILGVMGLISGEIYNETLLREGFESLTTLYGSRGYINFSPVPIHDFDDQNNIVNLTINIDEDRQFVVRRINFRGNTTTRDKVIRREVMLQEGSVFNSRLWDMSMLRLNQLGYFEEVNEESADIRPNPTLPEVDITLTVNEQGRQSIGFNGGVSGIGGSFLGVNYSTNNFLGFGETLSINLQGGTRQSNYVFSFTEPYLFDRPISTGFSVFKSRYNFDQARDTFGLDPDALPTGFGFENRLNFEQASVGFNVFMNYPLRVFQRLGLTFQFNNSETDAVNPATSTFFDNVRQSDEERLVTQGSFSDFRTRSLIPTYTYNTVNNPMFPTGGKSLSTTFEFTGGPFGGNTNFIRPIFEFQYFKGMNRFKPSDFGRNTLALRIRGSYVRGFSGTSVPFFERFFMGGDFDIRGFEFRSISPIAFITRDVVDSFTGQPLEIDDIAFVGGDTSAVMNLEYRIPIVGPITLAPFIDIGNSWVTNKDQLRRQITDSDGNITFEEVKFLPGTNSGIRMSTGAELQVIMPVINAPFRLIFAYNPYRINDTFFGPATGRPFTFSEQLRAIKFTVGRTF
jgi:outer membrane protein insertion porin family